MDYGRVLHCTHEVVTDTFSNPSLYCQLSGKTVSLCVCIIILLYYAGVAFHFFIILMGVFWLLHISHVYLNILFPIRLNFLNHRTWSRGLHATEVTMAFILSAIGPITVLISGNEYNVIILPPIMCFPSTRLSIYTLFIPLVLMATIGVCLIIIIFWALIKVSIHILSDS